MVKKKDGRKLICTSETHIKAELTDGNTPLTRTDIEWRLASNDQEYTNIHPFAVLQFQRRHTIKPAEFNGAKSHSGSGEVFKSSSLNIVKQTTRDVTARPGLSDICVFDWDTLFILHFDASNHSGVPKGLLHRERVNDQEKNEKQQWGSKPYTFRRLLAAFLIRALGNFDQKLRVGGASIFLS